MARECEPEQHECGKDNGQGETVSVRGLDLQDGELKKSRVTGRMIVVTRIGRHAANVQLDFVAMTMQRFMIGVRVEVNLEPLHYQQRQRKAPHQRAAVRGSE